MSVKDLYMKYHSFALRWQINIRVCTEILPGKAASKFPWVVEELLKKLFFMDRKIFLIESTPMRIGILFLIVIISIGANAHFEISKNTKCKVFLKPAQLKFAINWHGQCKNGFANGLGTLRYIKAGKVDSIFYGILKDGFWDSGVYDTQGGYISGKFNNNNELIAVKDTNGVDDRNVIIRAFEAAVKAATQLSKEFEKQGNKASSKHYKTEAEKLSQQMD